MKNFIIRRKIAVMAVVILMIFICEASAQENPRENFFIAPLGETLGYGWNGIAYGGGAAIGAGTGGALGVRFLYAVDNENISFFEINVFARFYVFGREAFYGPFVQLNAGPVIYADSNFDSQSYGNISAGLTTGWRFLTGRYFYIEPTVRVGYPYLMGGGFSVGVQWGS